MNAELRQAARAAHPEMILLYRVGDFYELYDDDATRIGDYLGLRVVTRSGEPMAGFPHQVLEKYLTRLLNAGHRVAICEPVTP